MLPTVIQQTLNIEELSKMASNYNISQKDLKTTWGTNVPGMTFLSPKTLVEKQQIIEQVKIINRNPSPSVKRRAKSGLAKLTSA